MNSPNNVVHILACGPTGAHFKPDGNPIIGVNDAGKWGHAMDYLLFLNNKRQFTPERQEIIIQSKVGQALCIKPVIEDWSAHFKTLLIETHSFPMLAYFNPNTIYHTNTSAFSAMSYAFSVMKANHIVLWGVDFLGHKFLKFSDCAPAFTKFAQVASKYGSKIYRGSKENRLVLELWKE
jgi:hypothetical protein